MYARTTNVMEIPFHSLTKFDVVQLGEGSKAHIMQNLAIRICSKYVAVRRSDPL